MTGRLRTALHLVGRFFGHVRAQSPSPAEQEFVRRHLDEGCAAIFWQQNAGDQRHAIDVAHKVGKSLPGDRVAIETALLHDVGKRHAGLGAVSRSFATVLDALGWPMTASMRAYRDHGRLGAADLAEAGCGELVVAFALRHPGPPPDGVDPGRWKALLDADG